jgi:dTDP-4-dehydrorhamnose 3,5-epimerase
MPHAGVKDPQTVVAGGGRASAPKILGVQIFELGNVITRSGFITEVFRTDWPVVSILGAAQRRRCHRLALP